MTCETLAKSDHFPSRDFLLWSTHFFLAHLAHAGIIQSVSQTELKICLLNDTLEPIRVGDLVVNKSGTDVGTASGERKMPPFGWDESQYQ